jgi:peptidyl-prolyl cis-trans isomerase A (cyclophilin A)
MKYSICLFLFLMALLLSGGCQRSRLPVVEVVTEAGSFMLEIDTIRAPVTAVNFLWHVREGTLEQGVFYRTVRPDNQPGNKVKIEVVQGGLFSDSLIARYPVIFHETTASTGIRHLDGVVSMARNEPGTASTEFFICIGDQPELDFGGKRNPDGQGFAAFGRVIRGMETILKIHQMTDSGQYLINPPGIISVKRLK